jgi:1-acyl-sn-glycerol-3-phosphate acyltransferase
MRRLLRFVIRLLFKLFTRVTVLGFENTADLDGYLLAVNHLSRLDPPLVFILIERKKVTALVADKYKRHPFFRWIVNIVEGIWIARGEADLNALRQAREFLHGGGVLGIAPEGTRSTTHALIEAKTGAAYLADKAGVPVVPTAIVGTDGAIWEALRLRRPHISIQFGEPLRFAPVQRATREADLRRNTDEIMCQIAAMLPEKYRGVYAHHPRLLELLDSHPPAGAVDASRSA